MILASAISVFITVFFLTLFGIKGMVENLA